MGVIHFSLFNRLNIISGSTLHFSSIVITLGAHYRGYIVGMGVANPSDLARWIYTYLHVVLG